MECAACCVWKCRLWLHLLFLPLPFRQKQSVQPIVCILPNNRKPISANIFPSPNATAGFGCFKRQRKREREKESKKTWSTMAWAQHCSPRAQPASVARMYFPHWDYCECAAMQCASEWASGSTAHVVTRLKWGVFQENCFLEVVPIITNMSLLEDQIDANIRLECIRDCLSEVSHLMKQKGADSKWHHQIHQFSTII